ncbi:MAG: AI-2E family transporter [Verrucomicrobia bacterium]|nr:AI-2E family transporter [Verrucomicrobiota bacterium]
MPDNQEVIKSVELKRLLELAYVAIVFAALSWGEPFLLPILLAVLISFLLAPIVTKLERWRVPPLLAVALVVAIAFAIIGGLSATLSVQAVDLINTLPKYRDNIQAKLAEVQKGSNGPLNTAVRNITVLANDLTKASETSREVQQPQKVQIVTGANTTIAALRTGISPVLGPIGEFAVVIVLVIFMLLERKRLRNRFLRLIGHSRLVTTTLAVDEAGARLSGFLLAQLQVNGVYALVLGISLYFIGIPNALLWAVLTLILRFLPYVGLWISAAFPLILSFAISTSWNQPLMTIGLYIFLELFTNNVVEPFVLGGSTGMSPLAIIISALFWTWLWGPIGLLLAIPLTACLVVLGRYFPAFHICSVLLASDPPTPFETKLIRLLTEGRLPEARALVHELSDMQISMQTAEELILPAIRSLENDVFPGSSAIQTKVRIHEQMRQLIDEMVVPNPANLPETSDNPEQSNLVILPFVGGGDELVGRVLARLLETEGVQSHLLSSRILRSEKIQQLQALSPKWVVVSAVESRSAMSVGKMAHSIQILLPEAVILIGLWSLPPEGAARVLRGIRESTVGGIYTNLEQAVRGIVSMVSPSRLEHPLQSEQVSAQ